MARSVVSVQYVRLNSPVPSDLTSIPAHAFRGLSNLVEIELSHGKINNLDTESFSGTSLPFCFLHCYCSLLTLCLVAVFLEIHQFWANVFGIDS